ncbi:hypothetical protein [Burkholderia sp. Ac-20365]|jgi:hypothetical protein|uniref:hypothetical protein n=1 Tax=Burkholderia sp. Ac-20365 TaxID=2703897 RepID=UPI00197B9026|nr:hypothetical protein [Burkholderia sp. Ac-20365]MBN3760764.1 hypothetical protein [Burkholderia sp. Ac-20365]
MISVLFFVLLAPIGVVWAVFRLFQDMGRVFGLWLAPAALLIYFGALLFVVGLPAPDAAFESVFQWLSGYVIVGFRLPVVLLIAGIAMLVGAAASRASRRGHNSVGH